MNQPSNSRRQQAIKQWLDQHFGQEAWQLEAASADASFRRYYRVHRAGHTPLILMDAPPDKEAIVPWLTIAQRMRQARINVPQVLADDSALGLVLMSDLGGRWLLDELCSQREKGAKIDPLYRDSLDLLWRMQTQLGGEGLPAYDESKLREELKLFPIWFIEQHCQYSLQRSEQQMIEKLFQLLVEQAAQQPRVFVHRDYHSRNLLLDADHQLGVIDFQDAVDGPLTYDLVSLLKDCYIRWEPEQVQRWVQAYHQRCLAGGALDCDLHTFRRWFDLMGLQRHLKVLGIFSRLWYRDGKKDYLSDLPTVLEYVLECCARYGASLEFGRWLNALCAKRDITQAGTRINRLR